MSILKIQFRRGTAAAWTAANPVLALGEPGYETDTAKEKRGDGVTAWSALPYAGGTGTAVEVVNDLTTGGATKALSAAQGVVLKAAVDAKVEDNLTASTTVAPSKTAVSTALAAKVQTGVLVGSATVAPNAQAVVDALAGLVAGSALPLNTAYTTAVKFDAYRDMGQRIVTAPLNFTVDTTGAAIGGETTLALVADAVNLPTFAAPFVAWPGAAGYNNTLNRINEISFFKTAGGYYYAVTPTGTYDATPPTLTSAVVANATPSRIDLTWSEAINPAVSAFGAFAVNAGHTLTAHTYVDSTHSYLTTSAAFVNGEAARTLAYTQPGTNNMQDLAGNLLANITSAAITNNVSVPAPVFSAQSAPGGTQGVAYSYTFVASNTTSFALASGALPAGVTLNTATGVISGTPTTAATSTFVISATGPGGTTNSTSQSVTIAASVSYQRFSTLDAAIVESGTGPYTYTDSTAGNSHATVSNLKFPAGVAASLTWKCTTAGGYATLYFALGFDVDNTTPQINTGMLLSIGSTGGAQYYADAAGAGGITGAVTIAVNTYIRIRRDASNNLYAEESPDNVTWTTVKTIAGTNVDYWPKMFMQPTTGGAWAFESSSMSGMV